MGVELKAKAQAQVSMNLTDFEQTPAYRAFELVKREAERYGVTITGSEIVGLVPQKAIEMAAEFYLQIENFRPNLIFENRLAEHLESSSDFGSMRVSEFLESVARAESVPGGGSVAALAGALAAALGKMAIGFTLNRKKYESHRAKLEEHLCLMDTLLSELGLAVEQDSQAYSRVMAAQALPKGDEKEKQRREQELQAALKLATEIPLRVAERAYALVRSLQELRPISNPTLASDVTSGFWMAMAAAQAALENVTTNSNYIHDPSYVESQSQRCRELKEQLKQACLTSL
jgi:formiminotetrahydrofolate cyclodeaminase